MDKEKSEFEELVNNIINGAPMDREALDLILLNAPLLYEYDEPNEPEKGDLK